MDPPTGSVFVPPGLHNTSPTRSIRIYQQCESQQTTVAPGSNTGGGPRCLHGIPEPMGEHLPISTIQHHHVAVGLPDVIPLPGQSTSDCSPMTCSTLVPSTSSVVSPSTSARTSCCDQRIQPFTSFTTLTHVEFLRVVLTAHFGDDGSADIIQGIRNSSFHQYQSVLLGSLPKVRVFQTIDVYT